jgi:hypothetical protein
MSRIHSLPSLARLGHRLRLHVPEDGLSTAPRWKINGYRARVLIWTVAEWEQLSDRPPDAQYHPSGVWCAIRLDEFS